MDKREQAIFLMDEFKKCRPQMFFEKFNITEKGTHFVLDYLVHHNDEVISADLSNSLGVSTARMAKLLNNMEKKGLIRKYSSNIDARKTVIVLTKEGRTLISKHQEALIIAISKLIEEVGFKDISEFIRISYKMKNSMIFDETIIEQLKIIE